MITVAFLLLTSALQVSESTPQTSELTSSSTKLHRVKWDESDRAAHAEQFQRLVQNENHWTQYTEEILRYVWDTQEANPRVDSSYLIRLRDRYRIHQLKPPEVEANDSNRRQPLLVPETILQQWDGNSRVQIRSNREVEMRLHAQPLEIYPQPYSVFLRELGFVGSMGDFISETKNQDSVLIDTHVRVLTSPSDVFVIERRSRVRNGQNWKIITVRLDPAWNLYPISGSAYSEYENPDANAQDDRIEVLVKYRTRNEDAFEYDLICHRIGSEEAESSEIECRVRVHPLEGAIAFDDLRVHELIGNPTIRVYDEAGLISEVPYRPRPVRPKTPLSPLETWFWLNNVFLASFIVYCVVRILRHRQSVKSRAMVLSGHLESQHA